MEQSNVLQAGNYRGLTLTVMCRIEMSQCKTPAVAVVFNARPDPGSILGLIFKTQNVEVQGEVKAPLFCSNRHARNLGMCMK